MAQNTEVGEKLFLHPAYIVLYDYHGVRVCRLQKTTISQPAYMDPYGLNGVKVCGFKQTDKWVLTSIRAVNFDL